MKHLLMSLLLLFSCFCSAGTIETKYVKTDTNYQSPKTEEQWNKFVFSSSDIKWYRLDPFGDETLYSTLKITSKNNGIQNDSVNIVKYQAESSLGKFVISKKVYFQKSCGYRSYISVDWTSPTGRTLPRQDFFTETAKGTIIETSLFKFESGSTNADIVPMHNTVIFSPSNNKFYIINDDGNQTVFDILGVPIEQNNDGVSISIFNGKVGESNCKLVNMIPEDPSKPIMICLVHMLGDLEAIKVWYMTEGIDN